MNENIVIHKNIEDYLLKLYVKNRIPSCLLFVGPFGVGKTTLALRFASFLFSTSKKKGSNTSMWVVSDDPVYIKVFSRMHEDLRIIRGSFNENISIEHIRSVSNFLQKTSMQGGWRIVIINPVDMMNKFASNALLKILEDPPKKTLFILICSSIGRVLPTIKSRCQKLTFNRLKLSEVQQILKLKINQISNEEIKKVSILSGGSLGRAIRLIDTGGSRFYSDFLKWITSINDNTYPNIYILDKYIEKSNFIIVFSDFINWWLARLIFSNIQSFKYFEEIVPNEKKLLSQIIILHSIEQWINIWEKVRIRFEQMYEFNLNCNQLLSCIHADLLGEKND